MTNNEAHAEAVRRWGKGSSVCVILNGELGNTHIVMGPRAEVVSDYEFHTYEHRQHGYGPSWEAAFKAAETGECGPLKAFGHRKVPA